MWTHGVKRISVFACNRLFKQAILLVKDISMFFSYKTKANRVIYFERWHSAQILFPDIPDLKTYDLNCLPDKFLHVTGRRWSVGRRDPFRSETDYVVPLDTAASIHASPLCDHPCVVQYEYTLIRVRFILVWGQFLCSTTEIKKILGFVLHDTYLLSFSLSYKCFVTVRKRCFFWLHALSNNDIRTSTMVLYWLLGYPDASSMM